MKTAVWIPRIHPSGASLQDIASRLHAATKCDALIIPLGSTLWRHYTPTLPCPVILDLTARLSQRRARPLDAGKGFTDLQHACRLLRPMAVLVDPHPSLNPQTLPLLPNPNTPWWVLERPYTAPAHPHRVCWDLGVRTPPPHLQPAKCTLPVALLLRDATPLPLLASPAGLERLVAATQAAPQAWLLLPPDETPYQLRTAREVAVLRAALALPPVHETPQ